MVIKFDPSHTGISCRATITVTVIIIVFVFRRARARLVAGKPAYRVNNTAGNFRRCTFRDESVSFTFSVNISAAVVVRTT